MLVPSLSSGLRIVRTSVADLAVSDLVTDLDDLANNLVANAKGERCITPTSSDGVKIRSANTTSLNGNVDIVLLELLELELALLEVRPEGNDSQRLVVVANRSKCTHHFLWSWIMKPSAVSG